MRELVLNLAYLAGAISAPFLLYPAAVCFATAALAFIFYFNILSHSTTSMAVIATALVIAIGTMVLSVTSPGTSGFIRQTPDLLRQQARPLPRVSIFPGPTTVSLPG